MATPRAVRIVQIGSKKNGNLQKQYFYAFVSDTKKKDTKTNTRNLRLSLDEIKVVLGNEWEYKTTKTNRYFENKITHQKISRRKALDMTTKALSYTGEKKYSDFYRNKQGKEYIPVIDNSLTQLKSIHAKYPDDGYLLIAYGEVNPEQIGTDLSAQLVHGNKYAYTYITSPRKQGSYESVSRMFRRDYDIALSERYLTITKLQIVRVHYL